MQRRGRMALAACGIALLLACQNTGALHLKSQATEGVDFSRYRSYSQAPAPSQAPGLRGYSELSGRRLSKAIDERLQATGLTAAAWAEADLQVALSVNGQDRVDVWAWHYDYAIGSSGSATVRTGSLRVDVFDPLLGAVVWSGVAWQETLDDQFTPEHGQKAIERLMARYPKGDPPR